MSFLHETWERVCALATQYVIDPICGMGVLDAVDILLLAFILFNLYRFLRTRRAGRVLVGLCIVVAFSALVTAIGLPSLSYIVRLFAAASFFCVVVIFQPEIRDALEHLGNLTLFNPGSNTISRKKMSIAKEVADETVDAVMKMSKEHTGALIVFEGLTKLGDYIRTGSPVDACVTSKVLRNIFFDKAPLHDGALVIRNMRICAASCVLPSSTRNTVDFGMMGTRHRAAVGVTEVSDALVIVVSEQTGMVSVAQDGMLLRDVDDQTLTDILMTYMAGNAYLRHKKANMRKDYLEMMEKIARVESPVVSASKQEAIDREFEKIIGQKHPSTAEAEASAASVEHETDSVSNQIDEESTAIGNDSEM